MKKIIFSILVLIVLGLMMNPLAMANDSTSRIKNNQKEEVELIAKEINKLKPMARKLFEKARFIMVCDINPEDDTSLEMLTSIKENIKALKEKKMTVLLLSQLTSKKKTYSFLKKNKFKFSTLIKEEVAEDLKAIMPDRMKAKDPEVVTILDAKGNRICGGDAEFVKNWVETFALYETLAKMERKPVNADENPVAAALRKLPSAGGMLNTEADVYIYLFSASWCPPCRASMPNIVKERELMLKEGMKVEVVLVGYDSKLEYVKRYREEFKIPFYAICGKDKSAEILPGVMPMAKGIPVCFYVDRKGNVVRKGSGGMVMQWRKVYQEDYLQKK